MIWRLTTNSCFYSMLSLSYLSYLQQRYRSFGESMVHISNRNGVTRSQYWILDPALRCCRNNHWFICIREESHWNCWRRPYTDDAIKVSLWSSESQLCFLWYTGWVKRAGYRRMNVPECIRIKINIIQLLPTITLHLQETTGRTSLSPKVIYIYIN